MHFYVSLYPRPFDFAYVLLGSGPFSRFFVRLGGDRKTSLSRAAIALFRSKEIDVNSETIDRLTSEIAAANKAIEEIDEQVWRRAVFMTDSVLRSIREA